MGRVVTADSVIDGEYDTQGRNRYSYVNNPAGLDDPARQFSQGFAYAPAGNMTRKDSIDPELGSVEESLTYHYRNHAVVAVDGTASGPGRYEMEYDAAGNMTLHRDNRAKRVKEMAYDSTNRVRTITNPSTGEVMGKYWYDDGGFRVRRISRRETDGVTYEHEVLYPTMYMGLEIQKGSEGNMIENSYASVNNIYLNGLRVAAMTPSGETVYYLTDNVDSVRVVADERGKPVTRTEYLPYGETWFQIGNTNHAPKYNSQELDKESGLYYYNARYYDPEVGRFTSADSVIDGEYETQGWNRYSYVKGNPVRYGDPSGRLTLIIPGTKSDGSYAKGEDGNKPATPFNQAVSESFGEKAELLTMKNEDNSTKALENTPESREEFAQLLNKRISGHKFRPGEKLNIIAHSHGGNVVKAYTNMDESKKIDNLVTLGTPQRGDYPINRDKVGKYINVYSSDDQVQVLGGHVGNVQVGPARREDKTASINLEVQSSLEGDHPLPCVNAHSNLHTPEVWKKVDKALEDQKLNNR